MTVRMTVRASLVFASAVGCEDLTGCAASPGCPLPFTDVAEQT